VNHCIEERDIDESWQEIRFKVDLPALFHEIALNDDQIRRCPGIITALEIIKRSLYNIAIQAIKIKDKVILEELEVMGCIHIMEEDETHALLI